MKVLDAGYVYAPYVPLQQTPKIYGFKGMTHQEWKKFKQLMNSYFNSKIGKAYKGKRHCMFNKFSHPPTEERIFAFRPVSPRGGYKEDLLFNNRSRIWFEKI